MRRRLCFLLVISAAFAAPSARAAAHSTSSWRRPEFPAAAGKHRGLPAGAGAAGEALRFENAPDGRVSVSAGEGCEEGETLVSALGFELLEFPGGPRRPEASHGRVKPGPGGGPPTRPTGPREGVPARVAPSRGGRPPRVRVGRTTWRLSLVARRSGGGTVFDFRASPEKRLFGRDGRSPWEEREPVRVRLAAYLAPAMKGGRAILQEASNAERMVTLGPPERLGPDLILTRPDASGNPSRDAPLRERAHGRTVELYSVRGTRFHIETETPGEIEILNADGALVIRFAETLVEPDKPFAFAVFVGERPYAGPPVLLGEPEARFVEPHACFEVRVRAFGAWSREDVALRLVGSGRLGYYARDFVSVIENVAEGGDSKGTETERLEPRGWPYFAVRMPYLMSGSRAALSFQTGAGSVSTELLLPTVNTRAYHREVRRLSGVTLGAPGPRGTSEVARTIARLAEEDVPAARLLCFEKGWALIDPNADPNADPDPNTDPGTGVIDLEAAWRLDRALAEAGRQAVKLVIVHDGRGVPARAFGDDPEEVRAAFAGFTRKLRYASARWDAVQGFAASGIESLGNGPRAGEVVGYVRPVRERFRVVRHTLLRTRRRRRLWEDGILCNTDVFTGLDVPFEDAAALARFLSAAPPLTRRMAHFTDGPQGDYRLSMARGPEGALWFVEVSPEHGNSDDASGFVTDFDFSVGGLEAGRYRLEWWDPRAGRILTTSEVRVSAPGRQEGDGTADLLAPPFTGEIAGRLVRTRQ